MIIRCEICLETCLTCVIFFFCRILPILQKLFLVVLPFVLTLGEFLGGSYYEYLIKPYVIFISSILIWFPLCSRPVVLGVVQLLDHLACSERD